MTLLERIITMLSLYALTTGCYKDVTVEASLPSSEDKITIQTTAETEFNEKSESTVFHLNSVLTNEGMDSLMEIKYQVDFLDSEGNLILSTHPTWDGMDSPLKPGCSTAHPYSFQQKLNGSIIHSAKVSLLSVKNDQEVPPVHIPQPGEFLYMVHQDPHINSIKEELPIEVLTVIDYGGNQIHNTYTDPDEIRAFVDEFVKIKIHDHTGCFVTDNYNGIFFKFADGSSSGVRLILASYETHIHGREYLFTLEDFDAVWLIMHRNDPYFNRRW